jgi:hypothetical protein
MDFSHDTQAVDRVPTSQYLRDAMSVAQMVIFREKRDPERKCRENIDI